MRLFLAATLLAVTAAAQQPLVEACGSPANCTRVSGADGGTVRLGGNVVVSSQVTYEGTLLADAGIGPANSYTRPRISPADTNTPLAILGGMLVVSDGGPDIVIGGANARDGGVLVRFVAGPNTVASMSVGGVLSTSGLIRPQDGGVSAPLCQFGYVALANGDAGVPFRRAFSSLPTCVCTHVAVTNANPCVISTAPSVSAVGFSSASAGTDVVDWQCCGDL